MSTFYNTVKKDYNLPFFYRSALCKCSWQMMQPSTTTLKCCCQTNKRIAKNGAEIMDLLMKLIILPLLAAFFHWSYVITENYLIVVDLQIVNRENKYILTDLSIHCKEPKFGNTNLGKFRIELFSKSHKYSEICAAMKLPKNKRHVKSRLKTIGKCFSKSSRWINLN